MIGEVVSTFCNACSCDGVMFDQCEKQRPYAAVWQFLSCIHNRNFNTC